MANRWEDRDRELRDERGYERDRDDRGFINRAGDEVRSWFGDDEAERRRRMDEVRDERHDSDWRRRTAGSMDRGWERTRAAVRQATDRDRDGRRGLAEWQDDDRPWGGSRELQSYPGRSGAWPTRGTLSGRESEYAYRDRSFGDTSRYGTADSYGQSRWYGQSYDPDRNWRETSYTGRGPRGYKRGDERIREDVCDRLTEEPRIDASDIEVQVSNGEVGLNGSVRTREEKRFTEDVVERVVGVREVNNNLKVRPIDEVIGTARSGASVLGLEETPPPEPTKTK